MKTCPNEAVTTRVIRLPAQWDEVTIIAEEARDQTVDVCGYHARVLSDFGIYRAAGNRD